MMHGQKNIKITLRALPCVSSFLVIRKVYICSALSAIFSEV